MKKIFLCLIITLGGTLQAAVQVYPVSPATLAGWRVVGTDVAVLGGSAELQVPAGGELFQSFLGGTVIVHSVSSPIFSTSPNDWAELMTGPAALALTRQGDTGQLVLVVNDTVTPLPWAIPLDATGRSLQPLELFLGYDPLTGSGLVAYADQVSRFRASVTDPSVEVAISPGGKNPWPQDVLEVLVIAAGDESSLTATLPGSADISASAVSFKSVFGRLRSAATTTTGAADPGQTAGNDPGSQAAKVAKSTLEIYTPSAVRHQSDRIRAIVKSRLEGDRRN